MGANLLYFYKGKQLTPIAFPEHYASERHRDVDSLLQLRLNIDGPTGIYS
jgi:hypothetical protein